MPAGSEFVNPLLEAIPGNVRAIYLMGSLAHGGYSPEVSDIDLAVILHNAVAEGSIALAFRIKEKLVKDRVPNADRASLFVGTFGEVQSRIPGSTRFTSFDISDLIHSGKCLWGEEKAKDMLRPPSREELILDTAKFALSPVLKNAVSGGVEGLRDLYRTDYPLFTKVFLFPARYLYSLEHLISGNNEAAVRHYLFCYQDESAKLVEKALSWRMMRASISEIEAIPAAAILKLYGNFLDVFIRELLLMEERGTAAELEAFNEELEKAF